MLFYHITLCRALGSRRKWGKDTLGMRKGKDMRAFFLVGGIVTSGIAKGSLFRGVLMYSS